MSDWKRMPPTDVTFKVTDPNGTAGQPYSIEVISKKELKEKLEAAVGKYCDEFEPEEVYRKDLTEFLAKELGL